MRRAEEEQRRFVADRANPPLVSSGGRPLNPSGLAVSRIRPATPEDGPSSESTTPVSINRDSLWQHRISGDPVRVVHVEDVDGVEVVVFGVPGETPLRLTRSAFLEMHEAAILHEDLVYPSPPVDIQPGEEWTDEQGRQLIVNSINAKRGHVVFASVQDGPITITYNELRSGLYRKVVRRAAYTRLLDEWPGSEN